MPSTRVPKICLYCATQFFVKRSHAPKKFYCSQACMAEDYKIRLQGAKNPNFRNAGWYTCPQCQQPFQSYTKGRKYCSKSCYNTQRGRPRAEASRRQQSPGTRIQPAQPSNPALPKPARPATQLRLLSLPKRRRLVKTRRLCQACHRPFFTRRGSQHFCAACSYITVPCLICQTPFRKHRTNQKYTCSDACRRTYISQRQKGDLSHRWQGGKTSEAIIRRTRREYQVWRTAVFARDDYTCAMCRGRGGKLAAHHIFPVRDYPERIYDVDNGITLCWPCHHSIHSKEEQYAAQFVAAVASRQAS